ncbi:hypothetical protein FSP39_021762 [Pinctada imbricata]|uniref:Uncharacterized protein n=1 Tax=Pinctada imbricata TaxID=66713 RepID=A0AA89C8G0_PINIB|nr:hypothetical protein FSP39_021762 [Pinctada imbricata]
MDNLDTRMEDLERKNEYQDSIMDVSVASVGHEIEIFKTPEIHEVEEDLTNLSPRTCTDFDILRKRISLKTLESVESFLQPKSVACSFLIVDKDLDIARSVGVVRSHRNNSMVSEPDKKAMSELLCHIYDVTGEIYEDIPEVFRANHVTLALYLKSCLMKSTKQTD